MGLGEEIGKIEIGMLGSAGKAGELIILLRWLCYEIGYC